MRHFKQIFPMRNGYLNFICYICGIKPYRTMKKAILTLIILAISLTAMAQATQPCIVKQYNQKQQKTPLAGVQVEVRGAQTATSAANGSVTLQFATLKPGDRVPFRAATKAGFELMNKTAVEQWNISRDQKPFEIVLIQSAYFTQLKGKLKQSSVDSYHEKYEKALAELEKLQNEGKLKEEEYRQKLDELEDHYDNQLKNLDAYVDQFARIDLSELSEQEQRFIELAHAGRLDEAAEAYNALNAAGKYITAVENVRRLNEDIAKLEDEKAQQQEAANTFFAMLKRQVNTLKLAGGEENYRKAGELLKRAALADTTNVDAVWPYAAFAYEQLYYKESEMFYQICLHHVGDDNYKKIALTHNLATLYGTSKDYYKAGKAYGDEITYLRQVENPYYTLAMSAMSCHNYGTILIETHNFESAENILLLSYKYFSTLDSITPGGCQMYLGAVANSLGEVYRMRHLNQEDYEKAEKYYLQSLEIKESLYQEIGEKYEKYREDVNITLNDLGLLYLEMKRYSQAEHYLLKALKNDGYLYSQNPKGWQSHVAKTKMNLGYLYLGMQDYAKSLRYYQESLQIWEALYSHHKETYRPELTETLYNMGIVYLHSGHWDDAEPMFLRVLSVNPDDVEWSLIINSPLLLSMHRGYIAKSQYSLMLIYQRDARQFDNYKKYLEEALKSYSQLIDVYPADKLFYADLKTRKAYLFVRDGKIDEAEACLKEAYEMDSVNCAPSMAYCLNDLSGLYAMARNFTKAIETIDHAISFMPQEANYYDTKGEILLMKGDEQGALEMWKKVIELNPKFVEQMGENSNLYKQLKAKGLIDD